MWRDFGSCDYLWNSTVRTMCVVVGLPSVKAGSKIHSATALFASPCRMRGPDNAFVVLRLPFASITASSCTTGSRSSPFAHDGMAGGACEMILAGMVSPALLLVCFGSRCFVSCSTTTGPSELFLAVAGESLDACAMLGCWVLSVACAGAALALELARTLAPLVGVALGAVGLPFAAVGVCDVSDAVGCVCVADCSDAAVAR